MRIQCDVCCKKEASVYCTADEAALCDVCDQRVHHANKLASKHDRFSLLQPSPSHAPLCDICQEKRAVIFCQQDRAIMCGDCEQALHKANEHTQKHNRFLLTGIKLSDKISSNNSSLSNGCDQVPDFKSAKNPSSVSSSEFSSSAPAITNTSNNSGVISSVSDHLLVSADGSTSSISEYLIETLPGWHFEDFLLDSATAPSFGFSKNSNKKEFEANEDVLSFWDGEFDKKVSSSSAQCEKNGIWVPQAPVAAATSTTFFGHQAANFYKPSGLIQGAKQQETSVSSLKVNKKLRKDDGFTVPQIIQSVGSKRNRPFW